MLPGVISLLIIFNVFCIKSDENVNVAETDTPSKIRIEIIYESTTPFNIPYTEDLKDDKNHIAETTEVTKSSTVNTNVYCRKFKTCVECVKAPIWYGCGWCHDFGCTNKAEELCPEAEAIVRVLPIDHKCPRIEPNGPTLIPADIYFNLKMKLYSPDPAVYDKELICQLKIENQLIHVLTFIIHNNIYCGPVNIESDTNISQVNGVLQVIWGGADPFSNKLEVTVYNCEAMGTDCDSCRNIPEKYGCGWCKSKDSCVIGDYCSADFIKWTLNEKTCSEIDKKLFFIYF